VLSLFAPLREVIPAQLKSAIVCPCCAKRHIGEGVMTKNSLQYRNARLRRKIDGALINRPELKAVVQHIALRQPTNASLDQIQANLQERARAMIESKPELDGYFED
jgi:hypothetical protein